MTSGEMWRHGDTDLFRRLPEAVPPAHLREEMSQLWYGWHAANPGWYVANLGWYVANSG